MVRALDDDSLWDCFPLLGTLSVGMTVWELRNRYLRGEIAKDRFLVVAGAVTGLRIARMALLVFVLSIPILGAMVGIALVARLVHRMRVIRLDRST